MAEMGRFIGAVDIAEVYDPGCLAQEARAFGLAHGGACDARRGRDLPDLAPQGRCEAEIDETEPTPLIGPLPCGPPPNAMKLNKHVMERAEFKFEGAKAHLWFRVEPHGQQIAKGRPFLRERF